MNLILECDHLRDVTPWPKWIRRLETKRLQIPVMLSNIPEKKCAIDNNPLLKIIGTYRYGVNSPIYFADGPQYVCTECGLHELSWWVSLFFRHQVLKELEARNDPGAQELRGMLLSQETETQVYRYW